MLVTSPLRGRRRAAAAREILETAREHVAEQGPTGLALRAVARDLGMTVQALYHYFPSRNDLITALITQAYTELADAGEAGVAAVDESDLDSDRRFLAAAEGLRGWAIGNPGLIQLLYGTPLRHYHAPPDGGTTDAARRLGPLFIGELFRGLTPEQLRAVDFHPLCPALRTCLAKQTPKTQKTHPPPAAALFVSVWAHIHGLIALEAFGHITFVEPLPDLFRTAVQNLLADARRRMVPATG